MGEFYWRHVFNEVLILRHKIDLAAGQEGILGVGWCESTGKTPLAFPKKQQELCLINKTSNLLRTAEEKPDKISNYLHHKNQHRGVINNDGEITRNSQRALLSSALLHLRVRNCFDLKAGWQMKH